MRKYLVIAKSRVMESATFRVHYIATMAGNLVYLVIVYFLWKAIFASSPTETVNGMTFEDTFIYLALASAIFTLVKTWVDWEMANQIIDGSIIMYFIKPMDYQRYMFSNMLGDVITNFIVIFAPTFLLVSLMLPGAFAFGWNILFFVLALMLSIVLNFLFDFYIGILSFYTESIWGISATKEVIILLLSGAVVPLPFFPKALQTAVEFLPFQAAYNLPLQVLINKSYAVTDYVRVLGIQMLWIVILYGLGKVFFAKASKAVTVNGG